VNMQKTAGIKEPWGNDFGEGGGRGTKEGGILDETGRKRSFTQEKTKKKNVCGTEKSENQQARGGNSRKIVFPSGKEDLEKKD